MKKVFLADLTHTADGNIALYFPLGASLVVSYAQKVLGDHFEFKLFKFPEPMATAIVQDRPILLGFSNYSWNLELTYKLSCWAKRHHPNVVIVFGGPNFPVAQHEKIQFFRERPAVDFYVENEGEIGFSSLLSKLQEYNFDVAALKRTRGKIVNCTYLHGEELTEGSIQRIQDINIIPSPYLEGILDPFFEMPLIPMLETTRGCPFSCAFCADGLPTKSRIFRFDSQRTRDELHYIAGRIKGVNELLITDLNFGMYKQDIETAHHLAEVQDKFNWPLWIEAAAGKNQQARILEVAGMVKGAWRTGSAIQSSDPEVLKNVRRSNISLDTYRQFTQFANSLDEGSASYTEIILGLPGDTKEKHFESLRYAIESGTSRVQSYQAILLSGTEMASLETRQRFGLLTKFRVIPDSLGSYEFGSERVCAVEIEEIIVGSTVMPFEDYVSCRVMDFLVYAFYNNSLCDEIFSALKAMKVPVFDFLLYLYEHNEWYTPRMHEILASFRLRVTDDLYDSREEAEGTVLSQELWPLYLSEELGANESRSHWALLYAELEDGLGGLVRALKLFLAEYDLLTAAAAEYFDQLKEFIVCRKKTIQDVDLCEERMFKYDFKALDDVGYAVDPSSLTANCRDFCFRFFHDEVQKDQILTALNVDGRDPRGIARMVKRANLKKLSRRFELVA